MKISTYLVQIRRLVGGEGFEKDMKRYFDMGVTAADVVESELADHTLAEYDGAIRASGMKFGSFVSITDIVTARGNELLKNESIVKGYIDELNRIGVPIIMLAPQVNVAKSREEFYDMRERMVEAYGKMADYAEGLGVSVTIENQSVPQRADSYIRDCRYILDRVPKLDFVFDTGNFYCVGDDVLEAWDVLGNRSIHCHLKDWEACEYSTIIRQNLPPLRSSVMGSGLLPIRELLTRMKRDGYDGRVLLEINGTPFTTELMDKSVEFMKEYCDV